MLLNHSSSGICPRPRENSKGIRMVTSSLKVVISKLAVCLETRGAVRSRGSAINRRLERCKPRDSLYQEGINRNFNQCQMFIKMVTSEELTSHRYRTRIPQLFRYPLTTRPTSESNNVFGKSCSKCTKPSVRHSKPSSSLTRKKSSTRSNVARRLCNKGNSKSNGRKRSKEINRLTTKKLN